MTASDTTRIGLTRISVMVATDITRHSPRELRACAREAWLRAVDRTRSAGRIDLAVAEELRRAWPPLGARK